MTDNTINKGLSSNWWNYILNETQRREYRTKHYPTQRALDGEEIQSIWEKEVGGVGKRPEGGKAENETLTQAQIKRIIEWNWLAMKEHEMTEQDVEIISFLNRIQNKG